MNQKLYVAHELYELEFHLDSCWNKHKILLEERRKATTDFGKYKLDSEIKHIEADISKIEKRIKSLKSM